MRTLTAISLPITTFATLLAVVACGPAKDYVTVRQQPKSALAQAVESCQSGIKASTKNVQKFKTVKFCRVPADSIVDRTKEQKLELKDEPYYFEVSKKSGEGKTSDELSIDLAIGLNLPTEVSKETQALILRSMKNACRSSIQGVFSRSVRGLNLSINPEFEVIDQSGLNSEDQKPMNELQLLSSGRETKFPAFEMQAFANGAKFYPSGESSEDARCKSISGGPKAIKACRWEAFVQSNQKFCRQLTKMTGIWLGLSDVATERVACGLSAEAVVAVVAPGAAGPAGSAPVAADAAADLASAPEAPAPVASATPAEAPKKPAVSKFMKAASEEDPKKFFANTKLDLSELATILTPACPAFATISEPAPQPAKAAVLATGTAKRVTGAGSTPVINQK